MSATLESNPLLEESGLPRFDRITPDHVVPAVRAMLARLHEEVNELEANIEPSWDGLVEPLLAMSRPVERIWGPVHHLLGVRNSDALRKAHQEVLPEVVEFNLRVQQSRPIYDGLRAMRESSAWRSLSEAQQRVITLRLLDAELSGVGLDGEKKTRFNEIARDLSKNATDFSNAVLDSVKAFEMIVTDPADTDGWPPSLRQLAAQSFNQSQEDDAARTATPDGGPWRITLDIPIYRPFMQHSRNRKQREQLYRAYMTRASGGEFDNSERMLRALRLRREMAAILGYSDYADVSMATKMAGEVEAVDRMYQELIAAAKSRAAAERAEIESLARANGQTEPVAHWDIAFWTERLRESKFDYTDEQLRPYFPLEHVLHGLFTLCESLFDISIERADGRAPVWHDDVRYFIVNDGSGREIASFYLDPYTRPKEKRGGAWMDNCLVRRREGRHLQLPVVYLTCNGTPPVGEIPSLMSFDEVRTLFHEFGHGLQGMLTIMDHADVAGVSGVEWDAVEIASQFMENWLYHEPTLRGLTKHYKTGEPLPDDLVRKILASRHFNSGSDLLRQVELGMTDLRLHDGFNPDGGLSPFDFHRQISSQVSVWPYFEGNRFLCAFSHIFAGGYAAGYYSYLWSEVLSADAFSVFEEAGLDNEDAARDLGHRYRDTILASGGGRPPMDVFRDFRGREPSTDALLRHTGLRA